MAGVTQTIPSYTGGISQQADHLKFPGQVRDTVNSIPDVTFGLFKRPGSERKGTTPLPNVQSDGSWFHYYRDENEGAYIGQVMTDGSVKMWRCSDGAEATIAYGLGGEVAIKKYLTRKASAKYTRSGNTITVNTYPEQHGLKVGDKRTFDFTGGATDGEYTVVAASTTNTYTDDNIIVYAQLDLIALSGLNNSATTEEVRIGHQITNVTGLDNNVTVSTPATITNIVYESASGNFLLTLDKKNGGNVLTGNATSNNIAITITNPFEFTITDSASGAIGESDCTYIATDTDEELQFLTINDTTFVNNRSTDNPNTVARVNQKCTYSIPAASNSTTGAWIQADINLPDHGLAVGDQFQIQVLTEDLASGETVTSAQNRLRSGHLEITHDTPQTAAGTGSSNVASNKKTWIDDDNIHIIFHSTLQTAHSGILLFEPLTDNTPDEHFAMIELLRTENGRQYGLNINDTGETETVKTATRIRLKRHKLHQGNNSGHCPGIGTEVFDVSSGNTHVLAASNISISDDTITVANHGFELGDPLIYHVKDVGDDVLGNMDNKRDYYVKSPTTNNFKVAEQDDESAENLTVPASGVGVLNSTHTFTDATKGVVLNTSGNVVTDNSKTNLVFRITTTGQQGSAAGQNEIFRCSYSVDVTLLHGGEGWETGDQVLVCMASVDAGGGAGSGSVDDRRAIYFIEVTDHEEITVSAKYNNNDSGLVRPAPTPFDTDTAVSADSILGGILNELPSDITGKVIGSNLYLKSDTQFNVEVVEDDLMRVMQSTVNNVTNIPNQCKHGYIVQVKNSERAEEDDYYLKFEGENGQDGSGTWSECAKPRISKSLFNMPVIIQRTADNSFTVSFKTDDFFYEDRRVGDKTTNSLPTFIGKRVNKVLFFRNRLALLAGENVILSKAATLGKPDFFAESALTVSTTDPIDISSSSMFPSDLFDGIEINAGLLVFSSNQQFLLSSDDTILNPETAKLRSVSTYNYNQNVPPISLGTTVAYLDNSGKFSRFNEMANTAREGEPSVVESSKLVPSLLPKDLSLLTNSRENSIILMGKENSDIVFGYKYFNIADKRQQAAWFKWKLNNPLKYHFIINDEYYFIDTDNFLQCIRIIQSDLEPSIVQDDINYLIHLDNRTSISGGVYSTDTKLTTFSNVTWIPSVTTPNYDLVLVDTNESAARVGRYAKVTMVQGSTTSFTVPGNWSSATLNIGYLYEYLVEFPRIYPIKGSAEKVVADINASLVVHRVKFHFGKIGLYETNLKRLGKSDYPDVYDSALLNEYQVSDAPYLEEHIQTIPIYEKNENVEITLKSSHPAPATLRALSWEGDYSPRFYNRV